MDAKDLKVLMISSDRLILSLGSAVSLRMVEYGQLVRELHIVLLSDKSHGLKDTKLSDNVRVYPTNSLVKFLRPLDAVSIGEKIEADLITAQDPFECGWAGMKIKREKRIPLEIQVHTDPYSKYFTGSLNAIRKHIAKSVFKNADAVRVVLRSVGREVASRHSIGMEKIFTLPIYVDRSRINGEPKFDLHDKYSWKTIILSVSRLSKEKHIGMALKALKHIKDAGLVIVGSGPEEKNLRLLAKNLGVEDQVTFAGWQEDLASFYKTADIFVQTSDYEGYGLSLVEAGLSGLAVVTTPVGIATELENGREIILAEDTDSFASALSRLAENTEERRQLGQNLRTALEAKVLTKETYLNRLKESWEKTSQAKT